MKGQPLAYNKDNQEDERAIVRCDRIQFVVHFIAFADMIPALVPNIAEMREAALVTQLRLTYRLNYLVKNSVAFRDAHEIVGKAVALGVQNLKTCLN